MIFHCGWRFHVSYAFCETFRMSKMDTKKSVSSVILTTRRAVNGRSVNNRINETEAKIGI